MYIKRFIESKFIDLAKEYKVILLTGPRQVGKTTMLKKLMRQEKKSREYVSLDNMTEYELAKDPNNFFSIHKLPILIDEIQYAPNLFRKIKEIVDSGCENGDIWITGSQSYKLMKGVSESLAGRVSIIELQSLSQAEIDDRENITFDIDSIVDRNLNSTYDVDECFKRIYKGSMPSIISGEKTDIDEYYENYISSYIDRDVLYISKSIDRFSFFRFIRTLATRVGQELNINDLSNELNVNVKAINNYLSILETLGVIFFEYSYSNNLLKRTIKRPKLYFWDLGLATHIIKWGNYEVVRDSAISGHYFENFVISELKKSFMNSRANVNTYYYRDKDKKEVDFIYEKSATIHMIEIKKNTNVNPSMIKSFNTVKVDIPYKIGSGAIICPVDRLSKLDDKNYIIPVGYI